MMGLLRCLQRLCLILYAIISMVIFTIALMLLSLNLKLYRQDLFNIELTCPKRRTGSENWLNGVRLDEVIETLKKFQ